MLPGVLRIAMPSSSTATCENLAWTVGICLPLSLFKDAPLALQCITGGRLPHLQLVYPDAL